MTWKFKIISIKRIPNDLVHLHLYFKLYFEKSGQFTEYDGIQVKIKADEVNSSSDKDKLVKDLIKSYVNPIVQLYESSEQLKSLNGYEEVL